MRRNVSVSLTRLGCAAALCGAVLLAPSKAHAQDDVTLSMARERFKEGVAYFDKKEFAKARVAFLQAYALKKHPAVLLNLAQSELRSGHEADAAKHFAQYLREQTDPNDPERPSAESGLTAAKALVGELTLQTDAAGAQIYVDGNLEGVAPLPGSIYLPPGSHKIEARKEGKNAGATVSAVAGQASSLSLKLVPPRRVGTASTTGAAEPGEPEGEPEEAPEHHGRKAFFPWLGSTPGAMVGAGLTGVGAIGGVAFALGSKSAYDAAASVAKQIGDEAVSVDKKSDSSGACNDPATWLSTTSVWSGKSQALIDDRANQYIANCKKLSDNNKTGDTYKKLAYVSFAVAGAAAVGTIIYYFADSSESEGDSAARQPSRRVMVLPVYEPGFAGGLISGRF